MVCFFGDHVKIATAWLGNNITHLSFNIYCTIELAFTLGKVLKKKNKPFNSVDDCKKHF